MQHRGKIVEVAVRESGVSISRLAHLMGKSRRWVYLMFENEKVPLDHLFDIGQLIDHDFTDDIVELKSISERQDFMQCSPSNKNDYLHWKIKYYELLEESYQLLKKNIAETSTG